MGEFARTDMENEGSSDGSSVEHDPLSMDAESGINLNGFDVRTVISPFFEYHLPGRVIDPITGLITSIADETQPALGTGETPPGSDPKDLPPDQAAP